ncbi:hypothetical protein C8R45DRAFT_928686 [Mycena sanguinolenta]|nr:hypothetical protein C8R45DRAFT_928686 [Mycena sanguinolenta]
MRWGNRLQMKGWTDQIMAAGDLGQGVDDCLGLAEIYWQRTLKIAIGVLREGSHQESMDPQVTAAMAAQQTSASRNSPGSERDATPENLQVMICPLGAEHPPLIRPSEIDVSATAVRHSRPFPSLNQLRVIPALACNPSPQAKNAAPESEIRWLLGLDKSRMGPFDRLMHMCLRFPLRRFNPLFFVASVAISTSAIAVSSAVTTTAPATPPTLPGAVNLIRLCYPLRARMGTMQFTEWELARARLLRWICLHGPQSVLVAVLSPGSGLTVNFGRRQNVVLQFPGCHTYTVDIYFPCQMRSRQARSLRAACRGDTETGEIIAERR